MFYVKKVFFKISQNSQENICAKASFLIKFNSWFWKLLQKLIRKIPAISSFFFCLINVLNFYPLKTHENQRFSGFSEGIKWDHWPEKGWRKFNATDSTIKKSYQLFSHWINYLVSISTSVVTWMIVIWHLFVVWKISKSNHE